MEEVIEVKEEVIEIKEVQLPAEKKEEKQSLPPKAKVAKIMAIVIFSLVMSCLVIALVTDGTIFAQQIFAFIGGCLGAICAFIFGFILMVFSIVLIFGVYLLEERGFWPLQWASEVFHNALHDAPVTSEQITAMVATRLVILFTCIICFACSIVVLSLAKQVKKENPDVQIKQGLTKTFGILTLIFSILGAFAAVTLLLLISILN